MSGSGDAASGGRPAVELGGPLAPARFVERPNRFLVRCRLTGGPGDPPGDGARDGAPVVEAHLPDPGRLAELLTPGRAVLLRPAEAPGRKTDWTATLVRSASDEGWVSVDTTLPNRLVERALRRRVLDELAGWELEATEVALGASRIDFVLSRDGGRRLALEVKSVTLVEEGVGRFPDAVTARGARHVRELAGLAGKEGWEAAVLFVAQRGDVARVVADADVDPDFAEALSEARRAGVRALARRCRVSRRRVELGAAVPVG